MQRQKKSVQIWDWLIWFLFSKNCSQSPNILSYMHCQSEVQTDLLNLLFLSYGWTLSLPKVVGNQLCFFQVQTLPEDLERGFCKILEPKPHLPPWVFQRPTWMLVPGLAFDDSGVRLGYGKGFYDGFLAKHPHIHTIGLGFECQRFPKVPKETQDRPLDYLITEKGIYPVYCFNSLKQ